MLVKAHQFSFSGWHRSNINYSSDVAVPELIVARSTSVHTAVTWAPNDVAHGDVANGDAVASGDAADADIADAAVVADNIDD